MVENKVTVVIVRAGPFSQLTYARVRIAIKVCKTNRSFQKMQEVSNCLSGEANLSGRGEDGCRVECTNCKHVSWLRKR